MDEKEIISRFSRLSLNAEARFYIEVMARRFAYLLEVVTRLRSGIAKPSIRILDIGPSYFTEILGWQFPQDAIHCIGLDSDASRGGHFPEGVHIPKERFTAFNLNDSQHPAKWPAIPECDIVVMAEVIEHVYTAPQLVYRFIKSFLAPGGFLVVQTPNAAALGKRLRLLLGKNPYELIRENPENPGHFREYTAREMEDIARLAGLEPVTCELRNYFPVESRPDRAFKLLTDIFAPGLRAGLTCICRKPSA